VLGYSPLKTGVSYLAVAGTAILLQRRGEPPGRQMGRQAGSAIAFVAGGAVPSAIAVAWFAVTGTLATALRGFVVINVLDTHQPSPIRHPGITVHLLWHPYGWSLLLVPLGVVGLFLLAVRDRRLWPVTAGALAATGWSLAVLNGAPDLFVVLPFAALGVAGLVVRGARRLTPRLRYAALVAVTVTGVALAGVESVATRSDLLVSEQADLSAVLATQPPDATVLSVDTPEVLALTGRDNPTPYQLFSPTMERYLDQTLPGGMRGYAERMADLRATFVTVGRTYRGSWPDRVLAADYWRVGSGPGWTWYLNRAAGLPALRAARAANSAVMDQIPGHRFGSWKRSRQSPVA